MCKQHFHRRALFTVQLSPLLIAMIVSFGEKFELSEKIGSGSFGEIFFTRNIKTGENLATKSEKKSKKAKSQLRREAKIYLMLSGTGIVY